ncbi:MAG: queuosine precursor transporter [Kiritimatiellae bacterium]|nr:queuosine precursor transporter [Kiritimatiellia bacterium]
MSNEALWILLLLINFGAILLIYRLYGKTGLFVWIPIATILANIQVIKVINLFGFQATLGNIVYATTFLATDILSENHGKKEAAQAVFIGFFSLIVMTIIMNLVILFEPAPDDFAQESLKTIFSLMPRLALASFTAFAFSQFHDVWSFHAWKKRLPATRHLWIRNNASTMISQLIDTGIFISIAFIGVFPWPVLMGLFWTTYLLKFVVALLDTPLLYLAKFYHAKRA